MCAALICYSLLRPWFNVLRYMLSHSSKLAPVQAYETRICFAGRLRKRMERLYQRAPR
jgi:hypothetical protein